MRRKLWNFLGSVGLAALGLALPAYSATGPAARMTVGSDSVTVYSDSTVAYTGTCNVNPSPCAPTSVPPADPNSPALEWTARVDGFLFDVTVISHRPSSGLPYLDLGYGILAPASGGGQVTVEASDNGLMLGTAPTTTSVIGVKYPTTYTAYVDNTNALFGKQIIVDTFTDAAVSALGSFQHNVDVGPTGYPFSMTVAETVTIPSTGYATTDFSMVPNPSNPAPTASIGVLVWNDANNNAASTPDAGELGIPNVPISLSGSGSGNTSTNSTGNYLFSNLPAGTYTVCVSPPANYPIETYDLDGKFATPNCATVTLASGQNRTDVNFSYVSSSQQQPPPLTLTCPTGTATVGLAYSATLVASGGVPGYTYSVSAGALPPGLTLLNGVISGTPTTAGTFSFTLKVVDSTGAIAYSSCSGSCSTSVTSTINFGTLSGPLTNSHIYSVGGTSVTAYGFNNSGSGTGLYATSPYGLGIDSVYYNLIDTTHFVQFDLTAALAAGATDGQISIAGLNSCQSGESYDIYGSNVKGVLGTALVTGGTKNGSLFAIPGFGSYKYISVRAHSGYVLVQQLTFSITTTCSITVTSLTTPIGHGDAATIGFWHNKNGQALILALNGGSSSKDLGNWLANTFPYLYGSSCVYNSKAPTCYNFTAKTNSQVAAQFLVFFNGASPKTNAQILAGALAVYVTDSDLASTTATKYGFNSSSTGTGGKTYNIGSNGSAIGLTNYAAYTVLQLLQRVDFLQQTGAYTSAAANAFNNIFNGINTSGDII